MANTDGIFFHLSEKFCICAWGRVVHNAAPLERQSNADFFTQPAVQMQWLLFIYSPVVNVQISALSYQVSSLCFLSTHWSPPGTPGYYWRGWSLTTCRQCSFCPPEPIFTLSGHTALPGAGQKFRLWCAADTRVGPLQHLSHAALQRHNYIAL